MTASKGNPLTRLAAFLRSRGAALDMTEGNPLPLLIRFAVPLILSSVFVHIYTIVDQAVAGHVLGKEALASIGSVGPISFLFNGLTMGLAFGCAIITGQRVCAKDADGVRRSIAVTILICSLCALAVTAVAIPLTRPILRAMQSPPDVIDGSADYLYCIFGGTLALTLSQVAQALLRALGESIIPLLLLVFSAVLNITLDLLFVVVFGWGIIGTGIATILAVVLATIAIFAFACWRYPDRIPRRDDWRLDAAFAWLHLRSAIPLALQFSVTSIGSIIMHGALNTLGAARIAAFSAGTRIQMFVIVPFMTLGAASSNYVAQNIGAGRYDRVRNGVRVALGLTVSLALLASAIFILGYRWIGHLFFNDPSPDILADIHTFAVCAGSCFVMLAILVLFRNVLQGMGRPTVPFLGGVIELVVCSSLSVLLLRRWGYVGVCLAAPIGWIIAAIPLAVVYACVIKSLRDFGGPDGPK